jgi:hypothetical protein
MPTFRNIVCSIFIGGQVWRYVHPQCQGTTHQSSHFHQETFLILVAKSLSTK